MTNNTPSVPAEYRIEGGNFNIISPDIAPVVARNIANYYGAKGEPWATGMARRLRAAANDNVQGRRRAA